MELRRAIHSPCDGFTYVLAAAIDDHTSNGEVIDVECTSAATIDDNTSNYELSETESMSATEMNDHTSNDDWLEMVGQYNNRPRTPVPKKAGRIPKPIDNCPIDGNDVVYMV